MEALLGILIGVLFYHIYNSHYLRLPSIDPPTKAPEKPVVIIQEEKKVEVKIQKEDVLLLGILALTAISVGVLVKQHLKDKQEQEKEDSANYLH